MKAAVTVTSLGGVTLPVEVYTPEREREVDEAEAKLAAVLARKARPRPLRTTKR